MSFIKITPELIAAVGATGEEDFNAKLIAKLGEIAPPKKDAALTELEGKVASLESTVAALPKPLDQAAIQAAAIAAVPADLVAKAKAAGKEGAALALANTGSKQPANMSAADNDEGGKGSPGDALNAAGKFEEAWAADKSLQDEFVTAKSYAAFMRNRDRVSFHRPAAATN